MAAHYQLYINSDVNKQVRSLPGAPHSFLVAFFHPPCDVMVLNGMAQPFVS